MTIVRYPYSSVFCSVKHGDQIHASFYTTVGYSIQRIVFLLLLFVNTIFLSQGQNLLTQHKPYRLHDEGIRQFQHNQYGSSLHLFDRFLQLENKELAKEIDAQYIKAVCALNLFHDNGDDLMETYVEKYPYKMQSKTGLYHLGNHYFVQKDYIKASTYYKKIDRIETLPQQYRQTTRFRLGYSLLHQRKWKEALKQFSLLKYRTGKYQTIAFYYAGFLAYYMGDYETALKDLQRVSTNQTYAPTVFQLIAQTLYKQKKYQQTIDYIQQKDTTQYPYPMALLIAESYFHLEKYRQALRYYKILSPPKHVRKNNLATWVRAGFSAYTERAYQQAAQWFALSASDQDSLGVYASYYLGLSYLALNQKSRAPAAFDKARRYVVYRDVADASLYLYGLTSLDIGLYQKAIDALEEYLQTYPQGHHVAEAQGWLSQAYLNADHYNKAITYIEKTGFAHTVAERVYQKATFLKGKELFVGKQYDEAITWFTKSMEHPIDVQWLAESAYWRGESYSLLKAHAKAISSYSMVLKSSNKYEIPALYGVGYSYFNQKQYDQALSFFSKYVSKVSTSAPKDPTYQDAVLRLADCYYIQKDYSKALSLYVMGSESSFFDTDYALLQAAVILSMQSEYDESLLMFDRLFSQYPNSPYIEEATYQKAQLFFEQGMYQKAAVLYSEIVENKMSSLYRPYSYMKRGACFYNLKQYDQAANDYITIITKYTSHPISEEAISPLQETLAQVHRENEFQHYLDVYKQAHPEGEKTKQLELQAGKNYYFDQQYKKALSTFSSFVKNYPTSPYVPEALFYQAESSYRLNHTDTSLALYYKIVVDEKFMFRSKVLHRIAEIESAQGRHEKAIPMYREMARIASSKKDQHTAWLGLVTSFFHLGTLDSVNQYIDHIRQQKKINKNIRNTATLFKARILIQQKKPFEAIDELINIINTSSDQQGAEAKYRIARIYYSIKKHKLCYQTLLELNADFAPFTYWVGMSFLLMSDNFLAMEENFQAQATLQSLDQFPLEEIRTQAMHKLDSIQQEENKRRSSDTISNLSYDE